MFGSLLEPEIRELIAARNFAALRDIFADWPHADLAELLNDLPDEERVLIFRFLPQKVATEVFEYLEIESQKHLLLAMGDEQVAKIINEMSRDDRTHFLEELPSGAVTQLLRLLSPEERAVAQTLLNYPEHSVGRLMTPDYIAVRDDWTVRQVLDYVREHGEDTETLDVIYVVDGAGLLIDDIRIREFLLCSLDATVRDVRDDIFVTLKVTDTEKDAVDVFRKYHRAALPVSDGGGVLVGIVTIDDVLDFVEEETTSDIQKLGGSEALDEPYNRISTWRMLRKRAPWLIILFLS